MRSQTASEVMLDASTLCHFAKAGALAELQAYLGERARITHMATPDGVGRERFNAALAPLRS